jgi:hypothetical protein
MGMGVGEARYDAAPTQVDLHRSAAALRQHLLSLADRGDPPATDGDGLGDRARPVAGQDPAAGQDEVFAVPRRRDAAPSSDQPGSGSALEHVSPRPHARPPLFR